MTNRTCETYGCEAAHYAKGKCRSCYRRTRPRPSDPVELVTCSTCARTFQRAKRNKKRYPNAYCSHACRTARAKLCTVQKPSPAGPRLSPLTIALDNGDGVAIIEALRAKTRDVDGCWEWTGNTDKSGYPRAGSRGAAIYPHRLVIEAKLGAPLGSQHSHHKCANSLCINPDHLVPATYVENIAEMKARTSYVARINELEAALHELAPNHELLKRLPVARLE